MMKAVRSRENPIFRALFKLAASSKERRAASMTLLEGERLLKAYRDSKLGQAEIIAASEAALERAGLKGLFESTPAKTHVVLAEGLIERISQVVTSCGLLAVIKTPQPSSTPAAIEDALMLDRVQDPGNLGSMLRSALAAGVREVFLSPGSVFAWSPKVVRAGMGAHFGLAIFENANLPSLIRRAKGRAYATDPRSEATLYEADLRGPVAWLFGNEASGLSREVLAAAERLRIPMPGPAESLNLAAAAAICLFEQVRQRRGGRGVGVT